MLRLRYEVSIRRMRVCVLNADSICFYFLLTGPCSLPILSGDNVRHIVEQHVMRGPLAMEVEDPMPNALGLLVDAAPVQGANVRMSSVYSMGNLHLRTNGTPDGTPVHLMVRPDGTALFQANHNVTLETAIFPYMFPFGTGAYLHVRMEHASGTCLWP